MTALLTVMLNGKAYAETPAEELPVEIQDPAPVDPVPMPAAAMQPVEIQDPAPMPAAAVQPEVTVQPVSVESAAEPVVPAAVPEEPVTAVPVPVTPEAAAETPAAVLPEVSAGTPAELPAAAPEAPDQQVLPAEVNAVSASVAEATPSEGKDTRSLTQDTTETAVLPEIGFVSALSSPKSASQPDAANALLSAGSEDTLTSGNETETGTKNSSAQSIQQREDGSYILRSCNAESLTAEGDITILAAGVNRLTSISVNGNINLVGTGILLVDKIEMAEGCSFNLQTNTSIYEDGSGSVAVFLKQDEGSSYTLINGPKVKGLLDEAYKIPENVTLVMPEGSTLVMQSLAIAEATADGTNFTIGYSTVGETEAEKAATNGYPEEGPAPSVSFNSTAPTLTIPETAKLIVERTASILMNSVYTLHNGEIYSPKLFVGGELVLEGDITGGITELSSEDALSGTGQFSSVTVDVTADQTAIQAFNSTVKLFGTEVDQLALSGRKCTVENTDGARIGELALLSDAEVMMRSISEGTLTIGAVTGSGTLNECCYNLSLGAVQSGESNLNVGLSSPGVMVTGAGSESETVYVAGPAGNLVEVSKTGAVQEDDHYVIPVLSVSTQAASELDGSLSYTIKAPSISQDPNYFQTPVTATGIPDTTVAELLGKYSWIEVYCLDPASKTLKMLKVEPGQENSLSKVAVGTICLIRRVQNLPVAPYGGGGGVVTTTNMAYTGNGILGGSGAGSVQGGSAQSILTGIGITKPTSDNTNGNSGDNTGGTNNDSGDTGSQTGNQEGEAETATLAAGGTGDAQQTLVWAELASAAGNDAASSAETRYIVRAREGNKTLRELGGTASVVMKYTPPAEYAGKPLYVVFRNEDGSLTAIKATYSRITGQLRFMTDRLGTFMVVGFEFEGEEFSEEFYAALSELEVLQDLDFEGTSPV